MEAKEIKEYETGEHCFGEILTVNGKDYEDLTREEVLSFISDMFDNDINSNNLIREVFKKSLEYLQFDCIETERTDCDQCGNWNSYYKWTI